MNRYTQKDYQNELTGINKRLAWDLSLEFVGYGGRYNMTYSDRYVLLDDGELSDYGCIECGTPREALLGAYRLTSDAKRNNKITREQAKQLAYIFGVDFDLDFYQHRLEVSELLLNLAKASKYRKPRNANGSTARYFYEHLNKRVKVKMHYNVKSLNDEV